jgi:hypothetical protein
VDAHDALEVLGPSLDPWVCLALGGVGAVVLVWLWRRTRWVARVLALGVVVFALVLGARSNDDVGDVGGIDVDVFDGGLHVDGDRFSYLQLHRPTRLRLRSHDGVAIVAVAGAFRVVLPGLERELVVVARRAVDKPCADRCPAPLVCSDGQCRHGVVDLAQSLRPAAYLHLAFEAPHSHSVLPPREYDTRDDGVRDYVSHGCVACHGGAIFGEMHSSEAPFGTLEGWVAAADAEDVATRRRLEQLVAAIEDHREPHYRDFRVYAKRIGASIVYRDWRAAGRALPP